MMAVKNHDNAVTTDCDETMVVCLKSVIIVSWSKPLSMTLNCCLFVTQGISGEFWCQVSSVVLPIYKGKGDPMECGSYRGIKLLEHAMKMVERIFEHRIRQQIVIDDMQFGFMKGKG